MKSYNLHILFTCVFLMAQVAGESQNPNKIQMLTGETIELSEVMSQNPEAGVDLGQNPIIHWMDFDNDGDYDMIAVSTTDDKAVLIFSNKDSEYTLVTQTMLGKLSIPELNIMTGFDAKADVVWYDKNGDGFKDFFLSFEGSHYETEYLSNGDGTFQKVSEYLANK